MAHALATLSAQHTQFARVAASWPRVTIGNATPAPGAQEAKLAKEIDDLKTELSVDETLIYGALALARQNTNALDDQIFSTYGNVSVTAWLACVDNSNTQPGEFAGWTDLYGNTAPQCFANASQ